MVLSFFLILALGLIADRLTQRAGLPGLLGMIAVGMALGPYGLGLLDDSLLAVSSEIRLLALVVILLRAGLGLSQESLRKVGVAALKLSALPCLLEGFSILVAAHWILGLPVVEAGILGFVVAAVSPAVVVPAMLHLKERLLGMEKGIPVLILAAASVDDVFAITLFTAFLGVATRSESAISLQVLMIPVQVVGGILLGLVAGRLVTAVLRWRRLDLADAEHLAVVLVAALLVLLAGDHLRMAGLLGVMTLGLVVVEGSVEVAKHVERGLSQVWFFAQVFLFVLIGAEVNLQVACEAGLAGVVIVALGLLGRTLGVALALRGSHLDVGERAFCAVAYTPKATVQAAVGGIPLAMGVPSGALILAIAVLAVVITAPLGAIAIRRVAPRLLALPQAPAGVAAK